MPGMLADRNEIADAPCEMSSPAGDWTATAPLSSLRTASLIDGAVSARLGTAENPVVIEAVFAHPVESALACLLDVNLEQAAYWRLQRYHDADMTILADDTRHPLAGDRRVVPPLVDPATLSILAPNQILGNLDPRDYGLLPKHILVPRPTLPIRALRWSLYGPALETDGTPAPAYRIGAAWTGTALTLDRHVGASGDGYRPGDTVTTGDGASVWAEPGIGRRVTAIDRVVVDKALRQELYKMMMRIGFTKPFIWLPSVSNWADNFFFGGVFRRVSDFSDKYISGMHTAATIDGQEWRE